MLQKDTLKFSAIDGLGKEKSCAMNKFRWRLKKQHLQIYNYFYRCRGKHQNETNKAEKK